MIHKKSSVVVANNPNQWLWDWILAVVFSSLVGSESDDYQTQLNNLMRDSVEECDYGFACLLCSKSISYKTAMRRHMREVHMKPKMYKCPPCDEVFANRRFPEHIRSRHPNWIGIDYERFRIPE